ncbi:MAG TPA: PHP domain-containing protein [Treponema sp.]|nr:PHP domain-containing protein [Treponema sp.]
MIDLHTHSTASDGVLTPQQLVQHAGEKKLAVLALTDHDTTAGIEEAQSEAEKQGIIFLGGIEITVQWTSGEFHLLGLGIKNTSEEMKALIQFLKDARYQRNSQMAQKLREQGVDITLEEVQKRFDIPNIGRPHFAAVLEEKGIVRRRQQAFDRYFAKGRPCYVDRTGADLDAAIKAIVTSGGLPVLAHPLSLYVSWGRMEETLTNIRDHGVKGLEAWHPGARVAEAERFEQLAHKLGMCVTAGSDYHGEAVRADRHIGYTCGKKPIDDRYYFEELKPLLESL